MMIGERNHRKSEFAFTASQWQELEQQVLTFKYIMSGLPVPPALISTVITTPSNLSSSSSLFPQHQHPQQLTIGLGCFQVGNGRKIDTEPGRCKRTDGKKWRCTKEAYPDSKYCEKHMHRSKSAKAKRQQQQQQQLNVNISATKLPFNNFTSPTSSSANLRSSCSPYPAISYSNSVNYPTKFQPNTNIDSNSVNYPSKYQPNSNSNSSTFYPFLSTQSPSSSNVSLSTQDDCSAGSHWLGLDGELHDDQHNRRDSRYCNQIEGAVSGKRISSSEASTVTSTSRRTMNMGYKIDDEDKEQRVGVGKEHDTQKLYHHFLGDWPLKLQSSHAVGVFPRR